MEHDSPAPRREYDTVENVEKRGPSPAEEAITEAFRAVQRLEAMEESFRERLAPILGPDYPRNDALVEVTPERPEPANLVKQIEEIAERASAVERRFSSLRERLAV